MYLNLSSYIYFYPALFSVWAVKLHWLDIFFAIYGNWLRYVSTGTWFMLSDGNWLIYVSPGTWLLLSDGNWLRYVSPGTWFLLSDGNWLRYVSPGTSLLLSDGISADFTVDTLVSALYRQLNSGFGFLTLQDKSNIRTLSVNLRLICTRCETGQTSSPNAHFSTCF